MTTTVGAEILTALFSDAGGVERAYRAASARGYAEADINLVMSEETRQGHFAAGQVGSELADKAAISTEKNPPEGTELGGPAGGTAATVAPAVAAVGTVLLLPGLALAGPVAIALAAAGAVGIAGGLAGALTNWGVPKARVDEYETEIRNGSVLIGVKPKSEDDRRYLEQEWTAAGGLIR
jgi:hypothetical protein